MKDLSKDIAVVTGAGTGLGREIALKLCRRGIRVVGFGRRADKLAETARLAGSSFVSIELDVSDVSAVKASMKKISNDLGFVSMLVNNAAVYPHLDILDETPETFMNTVSINLGGMVACSHAALLEMVQRGYGRILNVSTFADLSPIPNSSAYSVSKGAAKVLTRALIADICDRFPDIVINDWMPGALATDMGIPNGLNPELAAAWGSNLVLCHDRSLTGTIWERDTEYLTPRSFKGRIKDLLLMQKRKARNVASLSIDKAQ